MYDIAIIPDKLQILFKFNPLYWFIYFARDIILYHQVPGINVWLYCFLFASLFFLVGIYVFKKNQDKFIYYV